MKNTNTMIAHAAIKRSDGIISAGRDHSQIIGSSPYGTCKNNSEQGFLDSNGDFLDRKQAFKIALEAGQLKEKTARKRDYLISEDIWSLHENGDWGYDREKGYYKIRNI